MKQGMKRVFCFILALVMTITLVPIQNIAEAKDATVIFEDDFSDAGLNGWKDKNSDKVSEGQYALGQDGFNTIASLGDRADAIISADISVNVGKDSAGIRQGGTASLVVRSNDAGTEGYEFGLGVTKSGSGYLRLYRRGAGDKGLILLQKTTGISGVESIERNRSYKLTLAVVGQRIICYIDDSLFADITDSTYTTGKIGVKTVGAKGVFDNVVVQETVPQEVESLTVLTHSEKVSRIGKMFVTLKAQYNSVYGSVELNQDSEGVSISGLDGTVGNKTVTVSYGGKSTSFPIEVTEKPQSTLLWREEFTDTLSGYSDGVYTNKDYNFTYQFVSQNGKGVVTASNTNGGNVPVSVDLSVPKETSESWTQYCVSADVAATGDSKTSTVRVGQAALVVAKKKSGNTLYTYRVTTEGKILLYAGGDLLYSTTVSALGLNYSAGTKATLRAEIYEDYTAFYYNNKFVTIRTDMGSDNTAPWAGLQAVNGSVWFDNWKVTSLEAKGLYAVKDIEIVAASNLAKVSSVTSQSLSLSELLLQVTYIDGSIGYAAIKENMLSAYEPNSTKTQTITITYAGKTRVLKYTYVPYLFYDDFQTGYRSQWNFTTGALSSYSAQNGNLLVKYQDGGKKASDVRGVITGGENWSNYAVSADVFLDARAKITGRSRTTGLIARFKDNHYYEFRLEYNGSKMTGALYRFSSDGTTKLQNFGTSQLRDCIGDKKTLGLGVSYNLKLEVRGKTIKCYVDGVALPVFTDSSEFALSVGTAGIKAANNTCNYDNVIVQAKTAQAIKELRLSGTENNLVNLYVGFDIDLPSHTLEVVDHDGSYDSVPLTPDMISEFDNTAVGKQKITLNYQGFEYPATVNISERPEELKAFEKEVNAVKPSEAGEKEKEVEKLIEKYDSFSPYEISQLSKKVVKRYEEILEKSDRAKDKSLKGQDLLLSDHLNEVTDESWVDGIEGNSGKWLNLNGTLYEAQRPYNLVVNGWRCPDVYGEINSISADMTMLSQDMFMGIAMNIGEGGYYHVRISNKDRNEEDEVVYKVQLLKKRNNGHTVLTSEYLTTYDIEMGLGVKFNIRLTLKDGILTVYVNDTQVLIYDDSSNNYQFSKGECGLRISEGDGIYDNVRVYGKALERPEEEEEYIEPTTYKDDFEDEAVGSSPSHWQENYTATETTDNWKIYDKNNSHAYGTMVTNGATETWLHVFEKNPEFEFKFMADKVNKDGRVGFITRRSPDTAFVNIGYDFAKSKWYIQSQESEAGGSVYTWAENNSELTTGEWYTAKIEEDGKNVSLKINGKEVVSAKNVARIGFGRLGFYTNNASMYVDDVDCVFPYGDIPQDGLLSYVVEPDKYSNYMEIESTDNGKTLIGVGTTRKISTNAGQTWQDITDDTSWSNLRLGFYPTLLKLQSNGKYIQILQEDNYEVLTSSDMKTWKSIGQVVPPEDLESPDGDTWTVLHVNSATEFDIGGGQYRIFCPVGFRKYNAQGAVIGHFSKIYYSDDAGATWKCSNTTTKDILPGYEESDSSTWCESKIIQCDDGTLRMYYSRNYLGCMQYTVSKDNGLTWEGLYQIPEMQNAMTSFAIIEDPTERGTYYMLWINGEASYLGSMLPRVRPCLLKSTDGKNWEFLMNCEYMTEFNSTTNGESLYQILDPSLYVTEDYVYVTFGRSEREFAKDNANSHQAQRCYYLRVAKNKLKSRAWDASTIADMSYPKTIEFDKMPQTKFGKGDLFNTFGGTLKITVLNGKVTKEELTENCAIYEEPNMAKLGEKEINMYYVNGTKISYKINVVPNYNVKWKISDGGTVDPKERRVMEGENLEVKLLPDSGYTIDYVMINDEEVSIINRTLSVKDVQEDLDVEVVFRELTWMDYLLWIGGGVVLLAAIGVGGYLIWKKKKTKRGAACDEAKSITIKGIFN